MTWSCRSHDATSDSPTCSLCLQQRCHLTCTPVGFTSCFSQTTGVLESGSCMSFVLGSSWVPVGGNCCGPVGVLEGPGGICKGLWWELSLVVLLYSYTCFHGT